MEIKAQLTRQDFLEFNKYVFFKSRMKRSIFIALIFTTFWIVFLNYNQPFNFIIIFIELLVFALFWTFFILIIYWTTFARVKKMPDENGEILGEKTYLLSNEGLKQISANSESFNRWNGFKSIEENNKYIFLFVDKIAAYIIPKRVFQDSKEMTNFLDFVKERTKK
jgi:hypothetical protein